LNSSKVIDINEYRLKKYNENRKKQCYYVNKDNDEDRKDTFNLFLKVLVAMRKEI